MRKIVLALLVISSVLQYGFGQNKGVIQGKVFNSANNEPIAFAAVVIWGTQQGTLTDDSGNFTFTNVKPGYVELRVNSVGYEPYASEQLMVTNANKTFVEVKLSETAQAIDEVVVKASPFRRDIESPVSLRNIGIKELDKNPGGNRDISRVIQSFPGVASTPAYRNDVIVRGGGSSENRFYLDNVEIPNLNHFSTQGASGGSVGIVNIDFVREVNFYSGAFPVSRGNALSSVLEFKLMEGNPNKTKVRGTIGASDLALSLDGPAFKNTTYLISARRSYLQLLFSQLGLPFLPIYNDFQFKTHTNINGKHELTFIGLGAIDNSDLNLEANETERQRYILGYLPSYKQWNYTMGFVYKNFREHGYDTWVISRNMLNNKQNKYFNNIENDSNKLLDYSSFEADNKIRYENNFQTSSGYKLILGADGEYSRYENNTFRQTVLRVPDIYETSIDLFKWGIFGQIGKEFMNKKLTLSVGLRSDGSNFDSEMVNMLNQLSPRFSASYALTSKLFVNFNTGRYYQVPPYTALGYRNNAGRLVNKDNKLKYISSDHVVIGFDYMSTLDSKLSIEGFFKFYRNYPFSVEDSIALANKGADYGTYGDEELISKGEGRAYGIELLYQNKTVKGMDLTISYTLVRSEFKNYVGKYLPSAWDNRHILNILYRKELGRNWDIGLKWRYVGGSPYTPIDIARSELVQQWNVRNQGYLDYSRFNSERLKAFHQLDLRVDKSYFFNKWSLMAYLDIQNAYDFQADSPPIYVIDYNVPVRSNPDRYTLKTLENSGGGTIVPTVGIIVQF